MAPRWTESEKRDFIVKLDVSNAGRTAYRFNRSLNALLNGGINPAVVNSLTAKAADVHLPTAQVFEDERSLEATMYQELDAYDASGKKVRGTIDTTSRAGRAWIKKKNHWRLMKRTQKMNAEAQLLMKEHDISPLPASDYQTHREKLEKLKKGM